MAAPKVPTQERLMNMRAIQGGDSVSSSMVANTLDITRTSANSALKEAVSHGLLSAHKPSGSNRKLYKKSKGKNPYITGAWK